MLRKLAGLSLSPRRGFVGVEADARGFVAFSDDEDAPRVRHDRGGCFRDPRFGSETLDMLLDIHALTVRDAATPNPPQNMKLPGKGIS